MDHIPPFSGPTCEFNALSSTHLDEISGQGGIEQNVELFLQDKDSCGKEIRRLAELSPIEYDQERKNSAGNLGIRPSTLDKLVATERKEDKTCNTGFTDIEPWPDPVSPAELLSKISETVLRFIVCSVETAHAVALWVAMTWFIDVVQVAPLAVITAPEKRCGKSQLLFLIGKLVCRPLMVSNITPAALFRAVDAWKPTLLVDEADAFMRDNDELRGLLNCGHTRDSAYIVRVVGETHIPTKFNVWGAKVLAGIGQLADTIMDRSVSLELRRKLPHEIVERLRHAEPHLFETLSAKLARFGKDFRETVRVSRPVLPSELNDRAQDNWEPLLAIADAAGDLWPELARKAALKLSGSDGPQKTVGTELLSDIQEVFEDKQTDRISTADLIKALCADEERPWATYNRGRSISPRQVSARLKEYGITSRTVRIGYDTPKGYLREQFAESWSRYLSPPENNATTPQTPIDEGLSVADGPLRCVSETKKETSKPRSYADCGVVAEDAKIIELTAEDLMETNNAC